MEVSYKNGIVNLVNSIIKFGNGKEHHPELKSLPSSFLNGYKNVILLVIDAMGYNFLKKQKNSFLLSNLKTPYFF